MPFVSRLPQHLLVEDHGGVGREHRRGARIPERRESGLRLLARHAFDEPFGRLAGPSHLVDRGVHDRVVDVDLVEQQAPPRRFRRKVDHRRARRAAACTHPARHGGDPRAESVIGPIIRGDMDGRDGSWTPGRAAPRRRFARARAECERGQRPAVLGRFDAGGGQPVRAADEQCERAAIAHPGARSVRKLQGCPGRAALVQRITRAPPGIAARRRLASSSTPRSAGIRFVRFEGAFSWSSSESSGGIRRAYSRYPSRSHPVRR